MNRVEFTRKIAALIQAMSEAGENPIGDFLKRSVQEQRRLFDAGLSKCDGVKVTSGHQVGRALDVLCLSEDLTKVVLPKAGYAYWHELWERLGGKPMIDWDQAHFEG
jgi:hypothetical protein